MIHGHQADFFNSVCWKLSRFLVRYFWKPFERFGVSDPTSAARNYKKTAKCVHPYGITGIEITDMQFTLVKWKMTTRPDLSLYVAREVLMGPVSIT